MIKDLTQFQTTEYIKFINNCFAQDDDYRINALHCLLGIASEHFELGDSESDENFIEEMGDLFFYSVKLIEVEEYEHLANEIIRTGHSKFSGQWNYNLGDVLDKFKKKIFYQKEVNTLEALQMLFSFLNYILYEQGLNQQEVVQANIDKLSKRYPNGFSPQAAQARADKAPGE